MWCSPSSASARRRAMPRGARSRTASRFSTTSMSLRSRVPYQEGEVSHEKMRARTRLLAALHSKDPEAIKQAKADAIKAGYSNAAVGAIGRTPSDVFLFSKLPEADQQVILRQANAEEFLRYIRHAHMKLSGSMLDERTGKHVEAPAPGPSSAPAPQIRGAAGSPPPARPAPPPPPPPAWPPLP